MIFLQESSIPEEQNALDPPDSRGTLIVENAVETAFLVAWVLLKLST